MIGNGAQSEFQSLAMKAACCIDTVRLYDTDRAATRKAAGPCRGWAASGGMRQRRGQQFGAQIVTTCTAGKQHATILPDNLVGEGVHINAIGGACPSKTERAPAILERNDIFVEIPEQTRIEGEIQQMAPDHPVTRLWEVIAGRAPGRRDPRQITLFDSVGFAVEDFRALRFVRDAIRGTDFFVPLDLLADPDDPRHLFGMLRRAAPEARPG